MLFFDLEFYVPPDMRYNERGSLIFNPANPSHKILGGYFIRENPLSPSIPETHSYWIWDYDNNESILLQKVLELFKQEWQRTKQDKIKIPRHRITDALVCGFAIARIDLVTLFLRSQQANLDTSEQLFELYLKTKTIDLSDVSAFLFPDDPILYPKTADEVAERLSLVEEEKQNGKIVWDWYDNKHYQKIENRCKKEVEQTVLVYHQLINTIRQHREVFE